LEHLRHMRGQLDRMHTDILEVKERVGAVEAHVGALDVQYASLSRRQDRMEISIDFIKRRLDLVEA